MKKIPAFITLTLITLVCAALLASTNAITKDPILHAEQERTMSACFDVLPQAELVEELPTPEGAESLFAGTNDGQVVGYVASASARGYGGPIKVSVGVDMEGVITGLSVGGSNFAETAGLGSHVKDADFTAQFLGQQSPVALGDGIDGISGATVSSKAVVSAVNAALEAAKGAE